MPANPSKLPTFDASILDQLACPACLRELRVDALGLVCAGCGRGYPIVNGIPVLIAERAKSPAPAA